MNNDRDEPSPGLIMWMCVQTRQEPTPTFATNGTIGGAPADELIKIIFRPAASNNDIGYNEDYLWISHSGIPCHRSLWILLHIVGRSSGGGGDQVGGTRFVPKHSCGKFFACFTALSDRDH